MVNKKNVEEVASIVQRKEKILLTLITLDCVQMALLLFFANCITKTKLLQMIMRLTWTQYIQLKPYVQNFPTFISPLNLSTTYISLYMLASGDNRLTYRQTN